VSIAVDGVPAQALAQSTGTEAVVLGGPELRPPVERDWLELFSELFGCPPTTMPCERIARMRCTTFRSRACLYSRIIGDSIIMGTVWPLIGGLTASRIDRPCRSSLPDNAAGAVALRAWRELGPAIACPDCLSLPTPLSSNCTMAFVLGRKGPYRSTELSLAAALWTLLTALDLRIEAGVARAHRPLAEPTSLTPRELDVLELLGRGLTAIAIAHRLRISCRTVHKHLERVYGKLGVNDRLAAVLEARRLGLVTG
jgi:DNA-binding CsgD family transcriptional regulator